jgi:hypothetical protein
VTIDSVGGAFSTFIESKGSAEGHVKLRAHRELSAADLGPVARSINPLLGDAGIDMSQVLQGGDSVMDVDTEWPELRPRYAHMRSTVRFAWEGREQTLVEDHEFRFDWKKASYPSDLSMTFCEPVGDGPRGRHE